MAVDSRRAKAVLDRLERAYPDARCALDFSTPLELLVATVLAAQCTDERVNLTTPALFKKYRTAASFANSPAGVLEEEVRPCGFYRNKAKSIRAVCASLDKNHGGRVPKELDALVALPGIGRKTANIVLSEAYGIPGIAVDTHVLRVSARLGFSKKTDPVKMEFELMELIPRERWIRYNQLITTHGRRCCTARKPSCPTCPVYEACPWEEKPERAETTEGRAKRV